MTDTPSPKDIVARDAKPFVTPENIARLIRNWFSRSMAGVIFVTDDDQMEESSQTGIGFARTEFMAMLDDYVSLRAQPAIEGTALLDKAQRYMDGFDGKSELGVGPLMLRSLVGELRAALLRTSAAGGTRDE